MIDDVKPSARPLKRLSVEVDGPAKTKTGPPKDLPSESEVPKPADDIKADFIIDENLNTNLDEPDNMPKVKKSLKDKLKLNWPPGRKEWAVLVAVLLLIAGGVFALTRNAHKADLTVNAVKPVAKSDLVPSTLSGLPVAPAVNKIPVTAVMIENSDFARPQSGLSQAGVVFEAVAEGGVTRFMALYQDTAPSNLGPIRSVRPYYLQWALGFDASVAHVGGSPDALADVSTWNVKNLDEFYNGGSYHRITTREAPHNVYTSVADLNQLEASKGYNTVNFSGFPRKAAAPAKTPTAANISLALSGPDYNASYVYATSTNSYNRSEGGAPLIDANTNTQISPKVVIAIVVPETQGTLDATGAYYSDYTVIGSGTVYVFQDGTVTTGTWSKASNSAQIQFKNANNQTIKLDPGQTWVTAVTSTSAVSYTP